MFAFFCLGIVRSPRFANSSSELASKFPLPLDTRGKFLVWVYELAATAGCFFSCHP
jgi:hypothetical protein